MATEDNQEFYPDINDLSYSIILELSKQGDNYAKQKEFGKAIDSYYDALDLVPSTSFTNFVGWVMLSGHATKTVPQPNI